MTDSSSRPDCGGGASAAAPALASLSMCLCTSLQVHDPSHPPARAVAVCENKSCLREAANSGRKWGCSGETLAQGGSTRMEGKETATILAKPIYLTAGY